MLEEVSALPLLCIVYLRKIVGYGTLLQIILRKYPSIKKGILLDLPAVISQVFIFVQISLSLNS